MTGNKRTRERFGAVFFAFVMVTSMVAIGGAAFAGTAAAAATDVTGNSGANVDIGQASTTASVQFDTTIDGATSTETYTIDVSNLVTATDSTPGVSITGDGSDVSLTAGDTGEVSVGTVTDDIGNSGTIDVDLTDDQQDNTVHTVTFQVDIGLDTTNTNRQSNIDVTATSNGNTGTVQVNLQEPVNPTVTATPTRVVNDEITEVSFDIENHPSGAQANFAVDDTNDQVTSGTTSDGSFTFTADPSGNGDIAVGDSYTINVDYSGAAEFSGTDSTTVRVAPPLDAAVTYDPSPPEFDGTVQISGQLNNSVDSNGNPTFDSGSFGQLDLIRGNQDADPGNANTEATSLRVLSDGTITSNAIDIDDAGNYTLVYQDTANPSNRFILDGTTIESTGISGADVTATNGGNPVSQISSIQDSSTITLTQPNAGTGSNITRFVLSGANLEKLDLTDDGSAEIERVTLSDGSSVDNFGADDGVDIDTPAPDIDGDGDKEFDDGPSTFTNTGGSAILVANTNEATIESVVILANDHPTGDNDIKLVVKPAESGTLNIESQVEDNTENTPNVPDVTSSTSIDVPEQQDLNVQTDTQNAPMDDRTGAGPDGTRDSFNTVLTVTDSDGEGLKNTADGSLNSNDFDEVTITITSSNGEFGLDELDTDNDDNTEPNDVDFNNTGDDLTIASATLANDDDVDADTTEFEVEGLRSEQNTTLTFDVSVTTSAGDSYTRTVTTNITNSDTVSDLSLPSEVETGTTADLRLSVTDGVSSNNNRVVVLEKQGGVANGDDLFNVSETSNADVNAIVFNPVEGQVEFDTDGDITTAEQTRSLSVNNGEYVVEDVTIASAGVDHRLSVREYNTDPTAGALRAQLDNVVTSAGVSAYTITSDVDPALAGQDEQINLTVTENGNAVNGTELVELAGNTNIDQQGSAVDDVSGPSAVDTDGDSTEDVIQATINADESGTDAVNVSTNLNDNSKTGSVSLDVVQPAISTNLTGDLTLGLTSSNVEITAEDPRDGTALQDTDLRLTATNTTYDIDASDGSNIIDDDNDDTFDAASTSIADGNSDEVSLDENGTAVVDISTQEDTAGDQPLTLGLTVENDSAGNYFGDSSVGVGELSLVNAPDELDPGTDVSQTYQLVDANGDTVDLGTLQISGTGLDGSSQTKVTDEGFVNFDYTTSDSGTIEFKIIDSSDLAVNSDNNDGDGSAEFTVKTINVLEQVNLSLSADQTDVTPGDSVEFNLTREDFDRQTTGTLTIRNASGDTVDTVSIDQTATVTFDEAGEFAVEASKPTRPSVGKSFTNTSATISVQVGAGTDEELARFDSGDDGIIDRDEAVDAIIAFNTGGTVGGEEVTRDQAVQVIIAYNTGQTVAA